MVGVKLGGGVKVAVEDRMEVKVGDGIGVNVGLEVSVGGGAVAAAGVGPLQAEAIRKNKDKRIADFRCFSSVFLQKIAVRGC